MRSARLLVEGGAGEVAQREQRVVRLLRHDQFDFVQGVENLLR
jgi:hypothetical protein